jgi:hypothetical protein
VLCRTESKPCIDVLRAEGRCTEIPSCRPIAEVWEDVQKIMAKLVAEHEEKLEQQRVSAAIAAAAVAAATASAVAAEGTGGALEKQPSIPQPSPRSYALMAAVSAAAARTPRQSLDTGRSLAEDNYNSLKEETAKVREGSRRGYGHQTGLRAFALRLHGL